jgi:hypothetical protein
VAVVRVADMHDLEDALADHIDVTVLRKAAP